MKKRVTKLVVLLLLSFLLVGCFAGSRTSADKEAGLLMGIWHGWIAPFALILEIFNSDIGIYESHNRGFLYDLGFYISIIAGFGSLALFRKKRQD